MTDLHRIPRPPADTSWLHESETRGVRTCRAADGTLVTPDHLCPDMLRYSQIGAADGLRGRAVRGFFWLMRFWPVRP